MHGLRKAGCALALLVLPLGGHAAKPAADSPGATLPELLVWAEQHNPELAAMQHEAEAADARIQPAGALPDPMFSVEWRDIPNDSDFTLAPSRVGSMKYTVAQTLPLGGKLESKQQVAEAEAEKARRQRSALSAALRAKLATAFIQRYQAQQNEILLKEELMFLREVERVAQIRHANGLTPQQDALKAQIEQTTLKADLITVATEAGILDRFPAVIGPEEAAELPRDKVMLIVTGSQGERRAASAQLSRGRYLGIELKEGDSFLFSSRTIPGNERGVIRIQNALSEMGVVDLD